MSSPYESADQTRRLVIPEAEALIGKKFPCLDHGFIYLVDYMGGDASIVQAARVSYGLGTKTVNEDRGLIRYLMRHHHTTPFEMTEIKFHVKLPIFVARQWIRHRTACLAGETQLLLELPEVDAKRGQRSRVMTLAGLHELWHSPARPAQDQGPVVESPTCLELPMCNEETGAIERTSIVDIWQNGIKPVYRVTLENGYSIKMTKDHRCLTRDGWLTLQQAARLQVASDAVVSWDDAGPGLAIDDGGCSVHVTAAGAWRGTGGPQVHHAFQRGAAAAWPMRRFSRIASIEFAGREMTYDLEVSGPFHNFVANGFIVHNSVNEYSARYSVLPDEFYVPEPEHVVAQSTTNRQGGGEPLPAETASDVRELIEREQREMREGYERMLALDVRRELARVNLGVSQYTEWYWKCDLHNIFHFLKLRLDDHAQYEIRVYARAMAEIVKAVAPTAHEAFEDYHLRSLHLSRLELQALAALLKREPGGPPNDDSVLDALPAVWRERTAEGKLKRNREREEFLAKLRGILE